MKIKESVGRYKREPTNKPFYWNEKPDATFAYKLNDPIDNIIYCRKNLFLLPIGHK